MSPPGPGRRRRFSSCNMDTCGLRRTNSRTRTASTTSQCLRTHNSFPCRLASLPRKFSSPRHSSCCTMSGKTAARAHTPFPAREWSTSDLVAATEVFSACSSVTRTATTARTVRPLLNLAILRDDRVEPTFTAQTVLTEATRYALLLRLCFHAIDL